MAKVYNVSAENVREVIRRHPNLWIAQIAQKAQMPHSVVRYYLFGQLRGGKLVGGHLKDDIEVSGEGRNKKIRLKVVIV